MFYIRTPGDCAIAHSGAPGDTAAICLSFVSSYKTQSALHVICQRATHSDRYTRYRRTRDTQQLKEGWTEGERQVEVRHRRDEKRAEREGDM